MPFVCIPFLCVKRLILSSVSVVFDFNASHNDAVPPSPMIFPIDSMRMKKVVC